jgi:predicted  nucleic acid-binding Zn ribbon protein
MSEHGDYSRLRPPGPTPQDEICSCLSQPPIKLMNARGYNPIHCVECNLNVQPEVLRLETTLVNTIAAWRHLHSALRTLWFDAGVYQKWAETHLVDINSSVNGLGRQVQRQLNGIRRCYYWYFYKPIEKGSSPLRNCPACGKEMVIRPTRIGQIWVCEACSILAH